MDHQSHPRLWLRVRPVRRQGDQLAELQHTTASPVAREVRRQVRLGDAELAPEGVDGRQAAVTLSQARDVTRGAQGCRQAHASNVRDVAGAEVPRQGDELLTALNVPVLRDAHPAGERDLRGRRARRSQNQCRPSRHGGACDAASHRSRRRREQHAEQEGSRRGRPDDGEVDQQTDAVPDHGGVQTGGQVVRAGRTRGAPARPHHHKHQGHRQRDPDHARISRADGEALFLSHGGNSSILTQVTETLRHVYAGSQVSDRMFAAFFEAGLMAPVEINVQISEKQSFLLKDMATISREALQNLDAARLKALNEAGFLALAFFVVASLGNLSHMIALKTEHDTATA